MEITNPKKILGIGFILVLFGFVGPFLMVLDILPSTYFLSFLSFGASIGGLFFGMIGVSLLVGINRKREDDS
jgi:xanthine/uracil permease